MNHELAVHCICKRHTRSRLESKTVQREEDVMERILLGKNLTVCWRSVRCFKWMTVCQIKTLSSGIECVARTSCVLCLHFQILVWPECDYKLHLVYLIYLWNVITLPPTSTVKRIDGSLGKRFTTDEYDS